LMVRASKDQAGDQLSIRKHPGRDTQQRRPATQNLRRTRLS
jgi:hypothetical protein